MKKIALGVLFTFLLAGSAFTFASVMDANSPATAVSMINCDDCKDGKKCDKCKAKEGKDKDKDKKKKKCCASKNKEEGKKKCCASKKGETETPAEEAK